MRLVEGRTEIDDLNAFLDELGAIGNEFDCAVQALDADYVVGRDHLRAAVERADRAFERDENVAREFAVEILLYAAGRRQINRALRMGVGEGESGVVVVVHCPAGDTSADVSSADDDPEPEEAAAEAVRDLLDSTDSNAVSADRIDREAVLDFFDVGEVELEATDADLADLVRERVALLDVEK